MKPPSPSPVVSLSNHGSGGEEGVHGENWG